MKKSLFVILLLPGIAVANGNINIGGDSSFNNNQGLITVNATSNYTSKQVKNLERIEARAAEIGERIMAKGTPKEEIKALNIENMLLKEIKGINVQQMPESSKNNICKSKAKGIVNILGYELGILYRECDSYFSS